eukprot:m.10250 g.10250  ORF g.10250 m.10250 type:complete len:396 (+) comp7288_c0_seq1:142-1329(+)
MEGIIEAGGEDIGAIGDGAEGMADDLADGLNDEAAEIQENVEKEVADAIKVADEPPVEDPSAQDSAEKLAEDDPTIKEALTPKDGDVEALEPEGTSEDDIDNTKKSVTEKFKSYATSALKAFKGFFESDAGKLILEGVGTYFKFKMYIDLAQMGVKDIDQMIELIEGKDPDAKVKELTKIKNFVSLVTSLITIAKKIDQSAANGAMFASEKDPKKIAYQIKNYMFANAMEEFPDKAQAVTKAGTILIGQLGKAMRSLGFTGNMSKDQIATLLKELTADDSSLTAAVAMVSPANITAFTTAMGAYEAFATTQVTALPATATDPNTGHSIRDEATAFFRLPSGWKPLASKIQDTVAKYSQTKVTSMVVPAAWTSANQKHIHVHHNVSATNVVINHHY